MHAADAVALRLLRDRIGDRTVRGGRTPRGERHRLCRPGNRPLAAVERFELQEDVARALRRSVDLVGMRRASAVLCMQMVASGIAVAIDDTAERERFQILTYASYARLHEERRAILADAGRPIPRCHSPSCRAAPAGRDLCPD